MLWNGSVSVSVIMDEFGDLEYPIQLSQNGLTEGEAEKEWLDETISDIEDSLFSLNKSQKSDDIEIKEIIRKSIKYVCKTFFSRDPITTIHVTRIRK